jgi:hypothetical protein
MQTFCWPDLAASLLAGELHRRNSMRTTIGRIGATVLGCLVLSLALLGLPFALAVALLFRRRFFSSPRPGKQGLEDVFRGMYWLSSICGAAMVLLIVLGLAIGR